jgi:hypothetical protein
MQKLISATELAKMGKCEQQLYFDVKYGQNTELTSDYIKKGNREHLQFSRQLGRRSNWLINLLRWLLRLLRILR